MQVELTAEETATLHRVLTSYLSDLRFEVAGTDQMEFRERLKAEEEFLKRFLERLSAGDG